MEERLTSEDHSSVLQRRKQASSCASLPNSSYRDVKFKKGDRKKKWTRIGLIALGLILVVVLIVVIVVLSKKESQEASSTYVTVHTDCGDVKGRKSSSEQGVCYEFINIPYAKPPVGELRWKRTVPLKEDESSCWKGVFPGHVTTNKQCSQPKFNPFIGEKNFNETVGEEDCLYLTIRSPNVSAKLPVVVWIHGGGLFIGNNQMPGYAPDADLTIYLNAVTVNINYRLGLFGFISLKELWDSKPGHESYSNYGFMDQIVALEWVKRNIANFGGDADSVTILGESAGGTSVLSLMASPLAMDLFHRGIAQSPVSPRTNYTDWNNKNRDWILNLTGCNQPQETDRRNCLYKLPSNKISLLTAYSVSMYPDGISFPFPNETFEGLASLDPIVLPVSPYDIRSAMFAPKNRVPMVLSTMAQENSFPAGLGYDDSEWQKMHDDLKTALDRFNSSFTNIVLRLYPNATEGLNVTLPPQLIYETISTDLRWTCAANRVCRSFSESRNRVVYRMYVTHQPETPAMGRRFAFHGWDSIAFFDSSGKLSQHSTALKMTLRSLVKKFIYDGTLDSEWPTYPTGSGELTNRPPWKKFLRGPPQEKQCMFWDLNGFSKFST